MIWILAIGCGFIPITVWFKVNNRTRTSQAMDITWPDCGLAEERCVGVDQAFKLYSKYVS